MNRRNAACIARYNDRRNYPKVDDKVATKILAAEEGIATPELLGVVSSQFEVKGVPERVAPYAGFVIKPARGSGGKGILVITGRRDDVWLKPSGEEVGPQDLRRHTSNILAGLYSLGGRPDRAIIESLVNFSDVFAGFSYQGVPDVRVVIFKGFPLMAMTRLSTRASDGKANLHQGAVGLGLDIGTGRALRGVQYDRPISEHPDTGRVLTELVVPHWHELLVLAARGYEMTELGYLGADIVLDAELGPLVLELNARPGLAIQIANGEGMRSRLELIERTKSQRWSPEQRVAFSREHFTRDATAEKGPTAD